MEATLTSACARLVCFLRRHLCRGAEADAHGPVQETIEILQLQYTDKVIDVFCAGPALECRRGGDGPGVVLCELVGPCAQAQEQGLPPAIRAGKGWRGRRELAPRRSATRINCMLIVVYGETHMSFHSV